MGAQESGCGEGASMTESTRPDAPHGETFSDGEFRFKLGGKWYYRGNLSPSWFYVASRADGSCQDGIRERVEHGSICRLLDGIAEMLKSCAPSETTAQQDQRESAVLEERPVNEPAKGQTDSHQTPSNEDQRAACAEEGSGDSAKAKGPQVASPAAAHLTPREADPYVLLEMYQDDTRFQLCQRIANASLERNQKERENAELRRELAASMRRIEAYGFECEAGSLTNCKDWIELKEQFK